MDKELEPIECCYSGCTNLADMQHGWWGPWVYCTKHNAELLDEYGRALADSYSFDPDLDEDLFK